MLLIYMENSISVFCPTEAQVERFRAQLPSHADLPLCLCRTEAEFLEKLPEATAVFVWTFRQEWFQRAPKLLHVCTPAAGRDYFKVTPPPHVTLHYGSFHSAIMAETALGAVLAMAHGLLPYAASMQGTTNAWPREAMTSTAHRLALDTVGVLGCGHIGGAFAKLIRPLAGRVLGFHRNAHGDAGDGVEHVSIQRLDELLPEIDHLVCFLPSGPETDRLLSADRIARMRPTACFYNFGRGNVLDEAALAAQLRNGKLGGAVLDVFREEPLEAESPLRNAPRCFLYPHASAFSPDYLDLWFEKVASAMRAHPVE